MDPGAATAYDDDLELEHQMLLDSISKGHLVPVLGADINLCGRPIENGIPISWDRGGDISYPPSTSELALHLLRKATARKDLDVDIANLLAAYLDEIRSPLDSMAAVSLANVCQYVQFANPLLLKGLLPQLLAKEYRPTRVHDFLVKFAQYEPPADYPANRPYPCIVTTCYDQVLEQQLRKNNVPFHLVSFVLGASGGVFHYTPPGAAPGASQEISPTKLGEIMEGFRQHAVVIKLNGGIPGAGLNFAITEDNYIDYLSHQGLKESLPEMLTAKLTKRGVTDSSHLLFLGYSPRHWSLRVILRRIWSESLQSQNKRWTVLVEERSGQIDTNFWAEYALSMKEDIREISSLDVYMTKLTERLATLPSGSSVTTVSGDGPRAVSKPRRDMVFVSYSHSDSQAFDELMTMLFPIKSKLKIWQDRMIEPGAKWRDEIKQALDSAKAAILLVSPAFLQSDFIQKDELPPLLAAAQAEGCKILWIKLQESLVDFTPIVEYQALYAGNGLMNLAPNERNVALAQIGKKIAEVLSDKPAGS
jgi:SIR2-like domain/TIR domain